MSAGQRAIIARMATGMTKSALSARLGVAARTLTRWEESGVPAENRAAFAELAGLVPSFFEVDPEDESRAVEAVDCNYRSLVRTPAADRRRCEGFASIVNIVVDAIDDLVPGVLPPSRIPSVYVDGESTERSSGESPRQAAARLREMLGLGLEPIENMVELLESLGVVVVVIPSMFAATIDALSFWKSRRPVVLLNHEKKDPYRTRFDAGHELGHLWLGHGRETRVESDERPRRTPDRAIEGQANAFSGALLVPPAAWALKAPRSTSPYRYLALRDDYGVSAAALLYQAKEVGRLTAKQHTSAMIRYSRLKWRSGEPPSGRPHERPSLLGRAVRTVLREYRWSLGDFARHVGVPEKQLRLIGGLEGSDRTGADVLRFPSARVARPSGSADTSSAGPIADLDILFGG